jgi:hypothetical protein
MENGTNRKWQLPFVLLQTENGNSKPPFVCWKTEMENGSLFSLVGKQETVVDNCYFSKRARLCSLLNPQCKS